MGCVAQVDLDRDVYALQAQGDQRFGFRRLAFRLSTPLTGLGNSTNHLEEPDRLNADGNIMNFIIWLIVGGLIGSVASMIKKSNAQQGVIFNIVVIIVGAMLGEWFISPVALVR